jgi:hypothetical protein
VAGKLSELADIEPRQGIHIPATRHPPSVAEAVEHRGLWRSASRGCCEDRRHGAIEFGCLLAADAGGDLIGYVWPQDPGAQMRQAETMRLCEASAIAVGIAPDV